MGTTNVILIDKTNNLVMSINQNNITKQLMENIVEWCINVFPKLKYYEVNFINIYIILDTLKRNAKLLPRDLNLNPINKQFEKFSELQKLGDESNLFIHKDIYIKLAARILIGHTIMYIHNNKKDPPHFKEARKQVLKHCIETLGPLINHLKDSGNPILVWAVANSNMMGMHDFFDALMLCKKNSFDINQKCLAYSQSSALVLAAVKGEKHIDTDHKITHETRKMKEIITRLLQFGASPLVKNKYNLDALDFALLHHSPWMLEEFLKVIPKELISGEIKRLRSNLPLLNYEIALQICQQTANTSPITFPDKKTWENNLVYLNNILYRYSLLEQKSESKEPPLSFTFANNLAAAFNKGPNLYPDEDPDISDNKQAGGQEKRRPSKSA